jgi:hypothetical protein
MATDAVKEVVADEGEQVDMRPGSPFDSPNTPRGYTRGA